MTTGGAGERPLHDAPPMFLRVALPIPKRTLFTYRGDGALHPGQLVVVPVGRGERVGVVWETHVTPDLPPEQIKTVIGPLADDISLPPAILSLVDWISRYYLQPVGLVAMAALPASLRQEKNRRVVWIGNGELLPAALAPMAAAIRKRGRLSESTLTSRFGKRQTAQLLAALSRAGLIRMERPPSPKGPPPSPPLPLSPPPALTPEQADCVQQLNLALEKRQFAPFLLSGVTGSGKTEVYFQAARSALDQGRSVLILVPEIGLTPQMAERIRRRFPEPLALLHSGMTEGERRIHWRRLHSGEAPLGLGARSALFAPLHNLGLLVVDEEHDPSYKQDEGVPYHARDAAVIRAREAGAVILLGSATPSLESLHNVELGKYAPLTLSRRATGAPPPQVTLVDLRQVRKETPGYALLAPPLIAAMADTLRRGEQSLLFLNRRGYSPALLCTLCGHKVECPACSVALAYHKKGGQLLCHYCEHLRQAPDVCPDCQQMGFVPFGPGVERLEKEAREHFPQARILRLDRDSATTNAQITHILDSFRDRQADILIGTQMVAKGHHFPGLSLVGVVVAESTLSLPDFRAAERTFQMISQVSGRAGREGAGRALIQSWDPGHYAVAQALAGEGAGFARVEMALRKQAGFPPYSRAVILTLSTLNRELGESFSAQVRAALAHFPGPRWLGPSPAPIFRLRSRYRFRILARDTDAGRLRRQVAALLTWMEARADPRLRVQVDVDPQGSS